MRSLHIALLLVWLINSGDGFRIRRANAFFSHSDQSNVVMHTWAHNSSIGGNLSSAEEDLWMDEKDGQLQAHIEASPDDRITGHVLFGISWDANSTAMAGSILGYIPVACWAVQSYVEQQVMDSQKVIQGKLQSEVGVDVTPIGDATSFPAHMDKNGARTRHGIWMQFQIGFPEATSKFWENVGGGLLALNDQQGGTPKASGCFLGTQRSLTERCQQLLVQALGRLHQKIERTIIDKIKEQVPVKIVKALSEKGVHGSGVWAHDPSEVGKDLSQPITPDEADVLLRGDFLDFPPRDGFGKFGAGDIPPQ